jgi:hypothetical protein
MIAEPELLTARLSHIFFIRPIPPRPVLEFTTYYWIVKKYLFIISNTLLVTPMPQGVTG